MVFALTLLVLLAFAVGLLLGYAAGQRGIGARRPLQRNLAGRQARVD